jgi:putative phage-type endonuclease
MSSIGAAEAATALGYNPWKTPRELWMEKTGRTSTFFENEKTRAGIAFEEAIARMVAEDFDAIVRRQHFIRYHKKYPFISATPDRTIQPRKSFFDQYGERFSRVGLLEIKNMEHFDGHIPMYYWVQLQQQMAVTGKTWVVFAVLIRGYKLDTQIVRKDNKFIRSELIPQLAEFWSYVEKDKEPPFTQKKEIEKFVTPDNDKMIQADDEIIDLWGKRLELKGHIKLIEEQIKEIDDKLAVFAGDATVVLNGNDKLFSFKEYVRKSIDSKKLREDNPLLWEKYIKETKYRTLR